MEILDLFNGYSKSLGKMTAEQTKVLLAKLHGGADEADTTVDHQSNAPCQEGEQSSIQKRLRHVNDLCNRVFEEA